MGCVWSNADLIGDGYRFKIVKQIAEGGFSQILLCTDIDTNDKFAVKKIVKHSIEGDGRIEKEAWILRQLSNVRNVVPLLATVHTNYVSYLVFPFCRKGSIGDELLRRRTRNDYFNQITVIRIFVGICAAVRAVHQLGHVHRDLKVANFLWADDGTPLLTDFGSATRFPIRIDSVIKQRILIDEAAEMCSMAYRAPELFDCQVGSVITEAVDLWSLGCCLYALCYFVSPFDLVHEKGNSVALAVQSPEKIQYPDVKQFNQRLNEVIRRLLVVEPSQRLSIEEASNILMSLETNLKDIGDGVVII